ncbi:flippase-like domain-containing protein [bacterium SCSIO 12741]|nr:flippase-like domain-containing protein [bacterium SCSIO 12741]
MFEKVSHNQDLNSILSYLDEISVQPYAWILLTAVVGLMVINWTLEAVKWRILVLPLEKISLSRSIQAILAGTSLGIITPNRVGEYAGRVLILQHKNRFSGALATVIGSVAQTITTVLFGSAALYFYYTDLSGEEPDFWIQMVLSFLLILLIGVLLILYFNTPFLIGLLKRLKVLHRYRKYVSFLDRYSYGELLTVLSLSTLRYIVFSSQLLLLLYFFQVEIPFHDALILIPMIFIALTIIPTIPFTELPIRQMVSIKLLSVTSDHSLGIAGASFVLWFINLGIPAIAGTIYIFRSKLFRS